MNKIPNIEIRKRLEIENLDNYIRLKRGKSRRCSWRARQEEEDNREYGKNKLPKLWKQKARIWREAMAM